MRTDEEQRQHQHSIAIETAPSVDAGSAAAHHQLGKQLMRERRWREAVTAFEAAAAQQPDRPARHSWLGRARHRCWDFAGAAQAYRTALRLAPDREDWVARLAEVSRAAADFQPYPGMIIAHRGRVGQAPEDAVEGLATLPPHVAGVEVDVRLTRDGVPVLLHDRRVDRVTTGEGAVAELRFSELQRLRRTDGGQVPSLAAYLDACAPLKLQLILVDVKSATAQALKAVAQVVRAARVAPGCVLMVRDETELALARRAAGDRLRLGCFGLAVENLAPRLAAAADHRAEVLLTALGGSRYLANRTVVAQVQAAGQRAGASTINSWRALEAARVDGCDLLLTDVADQLDRYAGQPAAAARRWVDEMPVV